MGKGSKRRLLHHKDTEQHTDVDSLNEDGENSPSDRPLPKLVLKVSKEKKSKTESLSNTEEQPNHHKKKKKKHKHKSEEHQVKKSKKIKEEVPENEPPPPKKIHWRHREKEKQKIQKEPEISPFRYCLENLHRNLQRKDVYNIFSFPVTDMIAPGYSKIIKKPMDFLTMQRKIFDEEYLTIADFKEDFVLMCNNAMQYNGSDTIYYKHAEKMLSLGLKMLTKIKLNRLNKALGRDLSEYSDEDIQVDDNSDVNIDEETVEDHIPTNIFKKRNCETKKSKKEQAEEIRASIVAAAKAAREKLLKKHPSQKFGYLSTDNEGNTAFNVLNPDTAQGEKSLPTNIGKIAGKLTTGIPASKTGYKEDKMNKVVPVNYLMYGPYGSFGPSFDSSLSNLVKEESDLLVQTYGTDLGINYSKSILEFTKDSPYLQNYIDRLLDAITGNAHSNYKEKTKANQRNIDVKTDITEKNESLESDKNLKDECEIKAKEGDEIEKKSGSNGDVNDLMSLDGLGIDVSFLKEIGPKESTEVSANNGSNETSGAQEKLDKTADLLSELQSTQYDRLSSGQIFARNIPAKEKEIAYSVTANLKELMSFVSPKDVVSAPALQQAIGQGKVEQTNKDVPTSNVDSSNQNMAVVSTASENPDSVL